MTKKDYIRRTLAALCGTAPASPSTYHLVSGMADRLATVYTFDDTNINPTK